MASDPPPSLLMTPDRRRRLSQLFAEARQLAAQPRPDLRQVHNLLAQCVAADPGNIVYLDELLANLKRRGPQRPDWWSRLAALWPAKRAIVSALTESSSPQEWLQAAPTLLWDEPQNPIQLRRLAAAAAEFEFDEVEFRLLSLARQLGPDDPGTLRDLARALTRQGRFEESVGPWHAVAALSEGDVEAEQAIEDLRLAMRAADLQPLENGQSSEDEEEISPALLAQAKSTFSEGRLAAAEHLLSQAQAAQGADLAILAERHSVRLAASAQRVEIARLRAQHDDDRRAQALVHRLEDDHRRLEIELLALQTERYPGDIGLRLRLAERLRQARNYSGAIHALDEVLRAGSPNFQVLLALGECRQQLRQFDQALQYYLEAIDLTDNSPENHDGVLLARYRAGVLAAAMGQAALAREQFATIVSQRPDYRDVRQRLDGLDG